MSNSGVYQIKSKLDGRLYVGSSVDVYVRWREHKYNAMNHNLKIKQVICRAIEKYGEENFEWSIIELCDPDVLIEREQYWLDILTPFTDNGKGFNVRKVADSNVGIIRTDESKAKQRISAKGKTRSEQTRRRMSENWREKRSKEYFENLSLRVRGDNNPAKRPDVKDKISKSMKGRTWKHDEERVKRHSELRRGRTYTAEQRQRMSDAQQKNKTRSVEAKEKFSLAQRKHYQITKPDGSIFVMYSKELKEYCANNSLTYSNLISTAKNNKSYKGGWYVRVIE